MDILDMLAMQGRLPAQADGAQNLEQGQGPLMSMMYPPAENPFSPLGLVSATKTVSKGSGAKPLSQADYLQKQLQAMDVQGMAQQQSGVEDYQRQLGELTKAQSPNNWQTIAAGLSDFFNGTKNLDKVQAQNLANKQLALMGTEKVQRAKNDISQNQRNLIKDQLDYEKSREKNAADEEKWRMALGLQKDKAGDKLLPGQEQADKDFGKEYTDWNQKGGRAGYVKSKQDLADALVELQANPNLTGTLSMKATPAGAVSKFHPDSARVEQKVKSTIISMVKQLGANPTDTDLREIQKTVWDKDLPPAMNIEKIQNYLQQLETQASAKDSASKFFEQSGGTLKGQGMATSRPSDDAGMKRLQELRAKKAAGGK